VKAGRRAAWIVAGGWEIQGLSGINNYTGGTTIIAPNPSTGSATLGHLGPVASQHRQGAIAKAARFRNFAETSGASIKTRRTLAQPKMANVNLVRKSDNYTAGSDDVFGRHTAMAGPRQLEGFGRRRTEPGGGEPYTGTRRIDTGATMAL